MAYPRRGFVAAQTLGDECILRQFEVEANATIAYFIGDATALNASGKLITVTACVNANYAGVIQGLFAKINDVDPPRPLTFNQPTGGPYLTTGQSGFALVNVNPNQVYVAQLDVTASTGLIGQTVHVSSGTPNTRAGISGQNLRGTSLSTSADNAFKIVGLAPNELNSGRGDKPAGSGVLVKFTSTIWSQAAGI